MKIPIKLTFAEEDYEVSLKDRLCYQFAIGLLIYIILKTRSNLAYAISIVSRYVYNLIKKH